MAGPPRCLAIRELPEGQPSLTFAFAMRRQPTHLCIALILCIAVVGCAKRAHSAARVRLPENLQAYTELLAYAQSGAFASDVRAHTATNLQARFDVTVRRTTGTSLVELHAGSDDPLIAAQAANLMVTVLTDFASKHNLGTVELVDSAVPLRRR